jgi:nanoRNase/pAp phosphatase (c-di-AMP/oligoRNAs hydrolase)
MNPSETFLQEVVRYIRRELKGNLYIQTHNYPDADAVASAFALQGLLRGWAGLQSELIYEGTIQRAALLRMIDQFQISIRHNSEVHLRDEDFIILVDGCKSYKNVTDLTGEEICVIDHHQVVKPDDVPFADIRTGYGACSTIIADYYEATGTPLGERTSSALLIGLLQDTDHLTRGVSDRDLDIFNLLYRRSNQEAVQYSLRNFIELKDLKIFRRVIDTQRVDGILSFCYLPEGCPPALLGILGDFLLALEEIEFVALFARNENRINVSLRNEIPGVNAAEIARSILRGIGGGGGHQTFAGGAIPDASLFHEDKMFEKLRKIIRGGKNGA